MNLAEMLAMADSATKDVELSSNKEFELLAPGTYPVVVSSAEGPKPSKRANPNNPQEFGQIIELKITVTEGKYANRVLFFNNNIIVYPESNSAEHVKRAQTAMAIGSRERKVMLDSIGKVSIQDAAELIGASFKADVVVRKNSKGEDRNYVNRITPMSAPSKSAFSAPAQAPAMTASTTAAPARAKMPWEK